MDEKQVKEALIANNVTRELLDTLWTMPHNAISAIQDYVLMNVIEKVKIGNVARILACAGFPHATINSTDEPPEWAVYRDGYFVDDENSTTYTNISQDRMIDEIMSNKHIDFRYSRVYAYGPLYIDGKYCEIKVVEGVHLLHVADEHNLTHAEFVRLYHYSGKVQRQLLTEFSYGDVYSYFVAMRELTNEQFEKYYELYLYHGMSAVTAITKIMECTDMPTRIAMAMESSSIIEYLPPDLQALVSKFKQASDILGLDLNLFLKVMK